MLNRAIQASRRRLRRSSRIVALAEAWFYRRLSVFIGGQ